MRIIASASRSFVPAGHENPLSPGVLKKVLLEGLERLEKTPLDQLLENRYQRLMQYGQYVEN